MRRIFYIDPQGGSGNLGMYDYELLSRLSDEEIYFFGNETYDYLPLANINCKFWFKYSKYKKPLFKGLSYVLTMFRIFIMCLFEHPAVIHIQWIRIPLFDIKYYSIFKKIFKVKLVYTVHNILPHSIGKTDYKNYKKMYQLSDTLLVHTETTKKELIDKFKIDGAKIYLSPHGPLRYIRNEEKTKEERKRLIDKFQLEGKLIFSILGYQSLYKGTDLLIKAWRESDILCSNKDIVLIVAGSHASDFIKSNDIDNIIVIDGFISNLTFEVLIKISDLIVLPYRRIEQSGVLLTVVAQDKPYCATEVGELTTPIKNEDIGWIIPDISSKAIKETLESIIRNPAEIKNKARNTEGWNRIKLAYDWDIAAKTTQKVYNEV